MAADCVWMMVCDRCKDFLEEWEDTRQTCEQAAVKKGYQQTSQGWLCPGCRARLKEKANER